MSALPESKPFTERVVSLLAGFVRSSCFVCRGIASSVLVSLLYGLSRLLGRSLIVPKPTRRGFVTGRRRGPITDQSVCSADDYETTIPDDQVELVEVPVEGTGEWIETGERDEEFGLEITEWTGDWQIINVGGCVECQHQQEALLAKLDAMG